MSGKALSKVQRTQIPEEETYESSELEMDRLSSAQIRVISRIGARLAQATLEMKEAIGEFILWLEQQSFTAQQMDDAAKRFRLAVTKVGTNSPRTERDLFASVRQVLMNPGWVWLSDNPVKNAAANRKALLQLLRPEAIVTPSLRTVTCPYCSRNGVVVRCSKKGCTEHMHRRCAVQIGHGKKAAFFCRTCNSIRDLATAKRKTKKPQRKDCAKVPKSNHCRVSSGGGAGAALDESGEKQQAEQEVVKEEKEAEEEECIRVGRPETDVVWLDEKRKAKPSTAVLENYQWATSSNDTDYCIDQLESISASEGYEPASNTIKQAWRLLKCRCKALSLFYGNDSFNLLYSKAHTGLNSYEGKEDPMAKVTMLNLLKSKGFVLTPRMWTQYELLLLMIIILDPNFEYQSINQKKGSEELQNR